jgi:iron complex outermembrane receptor protein
MAAGVAIALHGPAAAADPPAVPPPGLIAQADTARSFSIAPQPLASALDRFAEQAAMSFAYRSGDLSILRSPGVSGSLTPREALQRLLVGTGMTFSFTGPTTITLARAPDAGGTMQLDPIQVQGYPVPQQAMIDNIPPPYAGGQVATGGQVGLLGNRGVMDTPFNQTSYTEQKAQDQQARTIRDVLVDDPSVRAYFADGGLGAENMRIRGFEAPTSDFAYGGLFGMAPTFSVMAELAERVEILKGPNAMLFGMSPGGNIGGTVNLVPKRAPDQPLTQVTANYSSNAQFGGHADIARRFGQDKQFGVRFNGVFRAGDTPIQWNTDQRALAVLGLDFRGERVRLAADFGYQYQYGGGAIPYLGVANGVPLPWAPNVRNNPGAQPWNYVERRDLFAVARAEVDLTERITAYAAFGVHDNRFERMVGTIALTASNVAGNATATPSLTSQYTTYMTVQSGLRGFVDTGPINHEFAFNATMLEQETGSAAVSGTSFASNFYNPALIARPGLPMPNATKTSSAGQSSFALADTLSAADKRLQLTVGARWQQVTAANFNPMSGVQTSNYDQSALSPSVALVFKPWANVSVYGNWIQGLQQGTVVGPTFANAGEIFPPFKATQYEAGVKVDWGKLTTTASVFQISQPSLLTNVANNTQYLGGEQVNQGLELNFFGEVSPGLRVLGGAMFLNAVLTQTQGGQTDGWIAPNVPGAQFNLAGEWDTPFIRGLTLSGRVIYTGTQYIDTTWPRRSLPEWTRFDIGVRYIIADAASPTGGPVGLRFNVENLFDANYWGGGSGATRLYLGNPRTFRVALTADF